MSHNPYRQRLKERITTILSIRAGEALETQCNRCGKLESDGVTLNICHVNDDGAQDRRDGAGNHYYKRLYDRVLDEARVGRDHPLSVELLCLECHGNPKRTDKHRTR
jgi:hypothetical protein